MNFVGDKFRHAGRMKHCLEVIDQGSFWHSGIEVSDICVKVNFYGGKSGKGIWMVLSDINDFYRKITDEEFQYLKEEILNERNYVANSG